MKTTTMHQVVCTSHAIMSTVTFASPGRRTIPVRAPFALQLRGLQRQARVHMRLRSPIRAQEEARSPRTTRSPAAGAQSSAAISYAATAAGRPRAPHRLRLHFSIVPVRAHPSQGGVRRAYRILSTESDGRFVGACTGAAQACRPLSSSAPASRESSAGSRPDLYAAMHTDTVVLTAMRRGKQLPQSPRERRLPKPAVS